MAVTRRGTITEEDAGFVETWENIAQGGHGIIRLDMRGDERPEVIQGRREFMITTEERMITQSRIVVRDLDPFLNGSFRPVIVPDSVTIKTNPNALSDEEIEKVLKSSDIAWEEWLKTIDSVATIKRMQELAEDMDDMSLKRYRQLEDRLVEVRPLQRLSSNDPQLRKFLEDSATGATPSPGKNNRSGRTRTGMSENYR